MEDILRKVSLALGHKECPKDHTHTTLPIRVLYEDLLQLNESRYDPRLFSLAQALKPPVKPKSANERSSIGCSCLLFVTMVVLGLIGSVFVTYQLGITNQISFINPSADDTQKAIALIVTFFGLIVFPILVVVIWGILMQKEYERDYAIEYAQYKIEEHQYNNGFCCIDEAAFFLPAQVQGLPPDSDRPRNTWTQDYKAFLRGER